MRSAHVSKLVILAFAVTTPCVLFADYSYQQTTQITGGSILSMMKVAGAFSSQARKMGDPIVSTVYLKGNRMAHVSAENIEIIDLDKETITQIDPAKRTYTVMTFQQMKEAMERAKAEMEKKRASQPTATEQNPKAEDVKMSFDVKVRKTGAEKQVSGLSTSEAIMTMMMNATDQKTQQTGTMAVTNDMWLVPEIPGYGEVRDFYMRFGEKMGRVTAGAGLDFSKMFAQNPGAGDALNDMAQEMQKIKGVPIMQIVRLGTTTDGKPLPAASEAPLPADATPAMPSASDVAKESAASTITSRLGLGGFGGFGHKKQKETPPPDQTTQAPPPTSAILMESQTTTSNFSSDPVDTSHFEVPAGYKQIAFQADKIQADKH